MKRSLFTKYFFTIALLIAVSFITLGSIFLHQVNRFATTEKMNTLNENLSRVVSQTVTYANMQREFSDTVSSRTMQRFFAFYEQNLMQCAGDCDGTVFITDTDGRIALIANKQGVVMPQNGKLPQAVIDSINTSGTYSGISTMDGYLNESSFAIGQIVDEDYPLAAFITSPASSTMELYARLSNIFIVMTFSVLAAGLVIAMLLVRPLVKPIKGMAKTAQSFGRGEYSARVKVPKQKNELYELAVSFNNMADSVENAEIARRGLVANVSHDLRTPMTVVAGFVDGIIDGTIKPDKQEYYLKIVSDEIKRLSRLATSMLELSKLESNDNYFSMSRFDISEIVRRIVIGFEQKLSDKKIELELDIPDELIVVANHDAMFQVIYNLFDNAVKYVDEGGKIGVVLSEKNGDMQFNTINTGSVIPAENMKHIFEKFYKADTSRSDSRNGSGLGLYIVKTIVNRHKGDVYVNSGNNTTEFSFIIPKKVTETRVEN